MARIILRDGRVASARLQQQVLERLRSSGCRLIGPNCLGLVTTAADVQLNASFAPHMPTKPGMSIASQSGALGIAILEYAIRTGVGVSHFVSVGNNREVLPQVLRDDSVDTVLVLFVPVGMSDEQGVIDAIADAFDETAEVGGAAKPVVANFLTTGDYMVRYIQTKHRQIPIYPFPEQAVRALAKVTGYADYLQTAQGRVPDLAGADTERARAIVRSCVQSKLPLLDAATVRTLLFAMGVSLSENAGILMQGALIFRVNIASDPLFGPVIHVERLHGSAGPDSVSIETVVRITPLTNLDAEQAVAILTGRFNGDKRCQVVLADLLLRLSRLVEEVPEIESIRLPQLGILDTAYLLSEPVVKVISKGDGNP